MKLTKTGALTALLLLSLFAPAQTIAYIDNHGANGDDTNAEPLSAFTNAWNVATVAKGTPGKTYYLASPLVIPNGKRLDMTDCIVRSHSTMPQLSSTSNSGYIGSAASATSFTGTASSVIAGKYSFTVDATTAANINPGDLLLVKGPLYSQSSSGADAYNHGWLSVVMVKSGGTITMQHPAVKSFTGTGEYVKYSLKNDIQVTGGYYDFTNRTSGKVFAFYGVRNVRVTKVRVKGTPVASNTGSLHQGFFSGRCVNLVFDSSTIDGGIMRGEGNGAYGASPEGQDIVFDSITVKNWSSGIVGGGGRDYMTRTIKVTRCLVQRGQGTGSFINLHGAGGGELSWNTMEGFNTNVGSLGASFDHLRIFGNKVTVDFSNNDSIGCYGITLYGNIATDVEIRNNYVHFINTSGLRDGRILRGISTRSNNPSYVGPINNIKIIGNRTPRMFFGSSWGTGNIIDTNYLEDAGLPYPGNIEFSPSNNGWGVSIQKNVTINRAPGTMSNYFIRTGSTTAAASTISNNTAYLTDCSNNKEQYVFANTTNLTRTNNQKYYTTAPCATATLPIYPTIPIVEVVDTNNPPTVTNKTVTVSNMTTTSALFSWEKATDDNTAQANLIYNVYTSTSGNIGTVAEATANGVLLTSGMNITSATITGLVPSQPYWVNVTVSDASGKASAYTQVAFTLPANVRRSYNIDSAGAKGDGSTNDYTPINNCLTAAGNAGGGIVYCAAGASHTHAFASVINIPNNVTLDLNQSTFKTHTNLTQGGDGYIRAFGSPRSFTGAVTSVQQGATFFDVDAATANSIAVGQILLIRGPLYAQLPNGSDKYFHGWLSVVTGKSGGRITMQHPAVKTFTGTGQFTKYSIRQNIEIKNGYLDFTNRRDGRGVGFFAGQNIKVHKIRLKGTPVNASTGAMYQGVSFLSCTNVRFDSSTVDGGILQGSGGGTYATVPEGQDIVFDSVTVKNWSSCIVGGGGKDYMTRTIKINRCHVQRGLGRGSMMNLHGAGGGEITYNTLEGFNTDAECLSVRFDYLKIYGNKVLIDFSDNDSISVHAISIFENASREIEIANNYVGFTNTSNLRSTAMAPRGISVRAINTTYVGPLTSVVIAGNRCPRMYLGSQWGSGNRIDSNYLEAPTGYQANIDFAPSNTGWNILMRANTAINTFAGTVGTSSGNYFIRFNNSTGGTTTVSNNKVYLTNCSNTKDQYLFPNPTNITRTNNLKYYTSSPCATASLPIYPNIPVELEVDSIAPTVANQAITVSNVTTSSATLSWTQATDNKTAQSGLVYYLYTSSTANMGTVAEAEANGTLVISGANMLTYTRTALTNLTTYHYQVVVSDGAGLKTAYTQGNFTTNGVPPLTPAAPTIGTVTSTSVQVTIPTATGAETYNLFRSTTQDGTYTSVATGLSAGAYVDETVSFGSTYYYKVQAVNSWGVSGLSPPSTAAVVPMPVPAVPAAPTIGTVTYNSVQLTITASQYALTYTLYRSATSTGGYTVVATGLSAGQYTDLTVSPLSTYFYRVAAVNGSGSSALSEPSSQVNTPTDVPLPDTPAAPTIGTVTSSSVQVTITASLNAVTYTLYRSTTADGIYAVVATGLPAGSYTDNTVAQSATYYYKVQAVNSAGSSALSAASTAANTPANVTIPAAPPAPGIVAVSSSSIQVSISPVSGATSYNLYRATSETGVYAVVATGLSSGLFADNGVTHSSTYYYKVSASNEAGTGPLSPASSAAVTPQPLPGTPAAPTIQTVTHSSVQLTIPVASDADSYTLYRSTTVNGTYSVVATGLPAGSYTDGTVSPLSTYYYKVAAVNTSGTSALSAASETVTTPSNVVVPSAPPAPIVVSTTIKSVVLDIQPVDGATSYRLYRSTSEFGTYGLVASGLPSGTFTNTTVVGGRTYWYKVKAENSAGLSAFSPAVSATTPSTTIALRSLRKA